MTSLRRASSSTLGSSADRAENEVELKPHEIKTLTLVPAAGSYEAHCSHFMHKQMGMDARIVVD